jgi:hypothetical protein
MKTLFVIDSFLSTSERAEVCANLIAQLRQVYPNKKILVINKFQNSWGIDKLVDYYYYHGNGFLLKAPPQEMLDTYLYERQYVYYTTDVGICENWLPLTGTSDHAADVFNSFVLASNFAKTLGYDKVFKIEYDTDFNIDELKSMAFDIENFEDYVFYGKRQEGGWAKSQQYLIDVHIIGFATKLFIDQPLLHSDNDFWLLCKKIDYYGKWVEYIIYMYTEHYKKTLDLSGTIYSMPVRKLYPKTKFDVVSSASYFSTAWNQMPKICRSTVTDGSDYEPNKLVIFYLGFRKYPENVEDFEIYCKISKVSNGEVLHENQVLLKYGWWQYHTLYIDEPVNIEIENRLGEIYETFKTIVTPETIKDLNTRFVFNN